MCVGNRRGRGIERRKGSRTEGSVRAAGQRANAQDEMVGASAINEQSSNQAAEKPVENRKFACRLANKRREPSNPIAEIGSNSG